MEEMLYWIIEYCKVLLGYGFLMFLWPMVVFRKFFAGKSATFRFSICAVGQIILVNTVILMLGLLHILNDWILRILFYGTFLYSVRELYWFTPERKRKFKYLINGTFGWKNFLFLGRRKLIRIIEEFCKRIGRFYKKHWLEYSLLLVAVVYGVIYFSWGVFHDRSYAFSDMYVHHSWIYQLAQGNAFSAGIYPEGMHCIIYALNALFGIRIFSGLLFIGGVNIILIIVAAYCLMKELFRWRYSAIIVLALILTFGDVNSTIVLSLSRMQCALPQEFGFPAIFICTTYLARYLRGGKPAMRKEKKTKGYWDDNLLVFTLALAATIAIHFYATFMAFFLCVGVAVIFWKNIFTKERFVPLVTAVILGVVIAAAPMVTGVAMGRPLQGSLYWGMNIIQGSSDDEIEQKLPDNMGTVSTGPTVELPEEFQQTEDAAEQQMPVQETSFAEWVLQKISDVGISVWEKCKQIGSTIYNKAYRVLFTEELVHLVLVISAVVLVGNIIYVAVVALAGRIRHKTYGKVDISGYLIIVLASLIYFIAFCSGALKLPKLIASSRLGFIVFLLTMMVAVIPFDVLIAAGRKIVPERLLNAVSFAVTGGLIVFICLAGKYHGYLYFEITRFDSSVQVTNRIIGELPENSYTIISPTEELYQVIEHGRHEELLTFLNNQSNGNYVLPTEYVFLFLEKKPIKYAHLHTFDGPEWLAGSKFREEVYIQKHSVGREYVTSEISEEAAGQRLRYYRKLSDYYTNLESRTIIESKAYEWCEGFKKLYPNEFKTYYEDEYFVCYYFRQNPQNLYNLHLE